MKALKQLFVAALALSLPLASLAQAPAAEPAKPAEAAPAPAPAPAAKPAAPVVQVYGTLNVNFQYVDMAESTSGNSVAPRFAISTDSSNVGVRGTLELAHGVKGVYQCETVANVEGEDVRGICGRNSRVGLSGDWGTLFYGNWDTPYKNSHYNTKADDPFGNTDVFGFQGLMGSPGYGTRTSAFNAAAATTASFDQRAANSIAYWTPKLGGIVSGKVQASVDELASASGVVRPILVSLGVNLDTGPFSAYVTTEYHEDAFGIRAINAANANNNAAGDLGLRVGAGYDLPLAGMTLNVMAMGEVLAYTQEDTTVGFKDYARAAYLVGAKLRSGDHELRARWSQALDPEISAADGTALAAGAEDDLGATSYALGYAYHIAKSTQLYAYFTQLMNDDRARYTFGVAGPAAMVGANTQAGSTLTAGGLGIRLAF